MKNANRNCQTPCECDSEEKHLTEIKFVGIEFDPKKIPTQELELNKCLQSNYAILERVQTATGLVFLLGKFEYTSPLPEEEREDGYCFPKLPENLSDTEILGKLQRGAEVA